MKTIILFSILTFGLFSNSFSQEYGWKDINGNIPDFPFDTVYNNYGDTIVALLTDVFFINDFEGWITTWHPLNDTAAILHTTDGGQTFEVQTTLYSCNTIHMLNENEGYAGGKSGFVYRTVDGGENWNFHGTTVSNLTDISFPPMGNTGYCCGINGNIWSIDSCGVTKMTSNINGNLSSISFPISSEEGWVCGGDVLRHYKNSVWNGDQDYPSGGYNAIYMVDSLNGWIVGDGGIIAHTEDGHNWFEQTNPNPNQNIFLDLFFLDENNGWAIGSGGTIVHTNNGGANWNVVAAGLSSNSLTGVHFTSPTNGYVVGDGKTLLKYTELSGTGSTIVETLKFEIFPNPAKNKIEIRCSEFKTESGILEILSLDGKIILKKEIETGIENIELELKNLKSGMYLCKLSTNKKSTTKKLIIE